MNIRQMVASVSLPNTVANDNNSNIKTKNSIGGGFAGYFTAGVISAELKKPLDYVSNKIRNNIHEDLGKENLEKIVSIADEFAAQKLIPKGIKVLKYGQEEALEQKQEIFDAMKAGFNPVSKFLNKLAVKHNQPILSQVAIYTTYMDKPFDCSTMYLKKAKVLLLPHKTAGVDAFSAMAEASRKFPMLQAVKGPLYKGIKLLTLPIVIVSVCSRNKTTKEGEQLSKKDKFTNFVRQNAGKLSMAVALPVLLTKVYTSAKSIRIAQKFATKEISSWVTANEGMNAVKNVLDVLTTGVAVYSGVRVKDWFQNQKDKKAIRLANTLPAEKTITK